MIIPPWLQPSDAGKEYTAAFHAGAAVAAERQRLIQDQAQAQMAAQARSDALQQNALKEQQQIQVEQARTTAEVGLKQQALAQAQQKIYQVAQVAARKFAAQQQIRKAIESGVDPAEANLRFGAEAFGSMAGVAPLVQSVRDRVNPFVPESRMVGNTEMISAGRNHWIRGATPDKGPTATVPLTENAFGPKITGRISDPAVRRALGTNAPPMAGDAPVYPPKPSNQKDAVKGQIYQTARGPLLWNGEHFVKP